MTKTSHPIPAQLQSGAVRLPGAVVQAAANAAPALGLTAGVVFLIPLAGVSAPFAMLVGTVIALCLALVIGEFARKLPTAGSFYTYVTHSIGPRAGFVTGVLLFAAYLFMLPFQAAYFASFAGGYFDSLGIHLGWLFWITALLVANTGLTALGVSRSLKVGLVALAFEIVVIGTLSAIILVQGGKHGLSATPFDPSHAPGGLHGAVLAIVYGIFAYAGFESATTLGEEAHEPRRTIPRALLGTVAVLGLFFVIGTYAAIVGFGVDPAGAKAIAATDSPYGTLGRMYVGSAMDTLVTISVISSLVGVNIVTINAGSRMFFAMGRDRLLPSVFSRVNARNAPGVATASIGLGALVVTAIASAIWGPDDVAAWAGFLLTLFFIGAYFMVTIGLPRFFRRLYPGEWSVVRHAVVPLLTVIGLGAVAYGNVYPLPPSPLRYFIWSTLATAGLAVVAANVLRARRPWALEEAGRIFGGEIEGEAASQPAAGTERVVAIERR